MIHSIVRRLQWPTIEKVNHLSTKLCSLYIFSGVQYIIASCLVCIASCTVQLFIFQIMLKFMQVAQYEASHGTTN